MRALPMLLCALAMPAGAAPAPQQPAPAVAAAIEAVRQGRSPGGCFYSHTVDRWRLLDSRHVLLYAPSRRKPWLVEFGNACPLLREGDPIVLEGFNGQVCGQAGDRLRARDQDCAIIRLYAITPDDARQLLDAKHPPHKPQTEAP